ncbi:MAG: tRNA epoxyqueuosine(34) reductase QueG [Henriciella sp.]|jgi:epoxyqueuosine reductase|uniref:tRNA epoxyqueuosine(34) reductase QueG n=1 Tax=Henriciella sp. TaxID=1968823 RepID=UPI000C0E7931|nr:tRNA epoxyqueuosine(34) reductase QueG [Henriciella sp.]MAN72465.1 tRNA epoxyqueuosine(34) reductase QueG [Henriciella sp.]MBF32977.1 tRNA epoxyqueuosine(34) reductase QueG [Hyphomonadaceae bacterium]PHR77100.1 MAG: tRNA epoxyqueuosine(34) reductase QueG [Henriciella sp.]|tara:strand:- start:1629 stop:2759 length:1131 start_codon:yes stop_codon:yes gene_type:complete
MTQETGTLEARLKRDALALGFADCAICRADEPWQAGERLEAFVEEGRHGEMDWMEATLKRRKTPQAMWEGARSAIMLAVNYGPDTNPLETLEHKTLGNISVYARGGDYHDLIKKRLKQLARAFAEESGAEVKVFVDTAPLMEKPLAAKAGLGWQGKHTNLLSRTFGNWLFLGAILTDAELTPDEAETDHCGSCTACLDVCPTKAFPAPYQLDARRCISYLTIEYPGHIPHEFRAAMGNRIYGCDDCLAICPWNKFASRSAEQKLWARAELKLPELSDLAALDDASFREVFAGSPVKRTGRNRMLRNVLIAIGNSGEPSLVDQSVIPHLGDEAAIVRAAAIWALGRLDKTRFAAEKADRLELEHDEDVRGEWQAVNQ